MYEFAINLTRFHIYYCGVEDKFNGFTGMFVGVNDLVFLYLCFFMSLYNCYIILFEVEWTDT